MAAEGTAGAQRLARTFRGDANLLRILISFTTDQPDAHPEMGNPDDTSDDTGHDGSSSRA